jgi:isopentenyl-diphosphate Delta-isomerase
VLVDDNGVPTGVADKATVHGPVTPRHLAFSCYAFDTAGRFLVTRRSADKRTFPMALTNTCCGHPAPGEELADAARRRMDFELGLHAEDLRVLLPHFSYRAFDGRVEENELCPVLVCRVAGIPTPRADEVESAEWWDWTDFLRATADPDAGVSPWAREQAPLLDAALRAADPPVLGIR